MTFDDLGKRRHGTPSTLHFCDELFRLYGSDDYNEAMGASFAVENWAAAGFWKELIAGLEKIKATQRAATCRSRSSPGTTRSRTSTRRTCGTSSSDCYDSPKFREEPFISAGVTMLDGVKVFWDGLNDLRKHPRARVA